MQQQFNSIEKLNIAQRLRTEDIYSLSLLEPLLNGYPFLPFTGSSFRPFCLNHIINDIVINNRKNIIEFGSGISTILIGRLIKKNSLDVQLLSIEHDAGWINVLKEIMKNEKLDDVVTIHYAPLVECKIAFDNNKWYDIKTLKKATRGKKFDMVIIDGPPAWDVNQGKSRYPAVPFISNKLGNKFSIYLDDVDRPGEQEIVHTWESEYGIAFNIAGKTLAYYYCGESFYTEPFI